MHTTFSRRGVLALLACAMLTADCGLEKQTAPGLAGPSEFATSVSLTASPEVLVQDGVSQSVITAVVRNESGQPIANRSIRWDALASTSRAEPVTLSETVTTTDSSGRTSVVLTSPPRPTEVPFIPDVVSVFATPVEGQANATTARSVDIRLLPPPGTAPRNNLPVPAFSVEPGVGIANQDMRFNAQGTLDENEPCMARCTYVWNFGDLVTATGMNVTHRYTAASTGYTVTLTVTDERGGVGVAQQDVPVNSVTGLAAIFSVNPGSPTAGNAATFDASGSTVNAGHAIRTYSWDFGDGTIANANVPTTQHTFAAAGRYIVTLTITDETGGSAVWTADVVVR